MEFGIVSAFEGGSFAREFGCTDRKLLLARRS